MEEGLRGANSFLGLGQSEGNTLMNGIVKLVERLSGSILIVEAVESVLDDSPSENVTFFTQIFQTELKEQIQDAKRKESDVWNEKKVYDIF